MKAIEDDNLNKAYKLLQLKIFSDEELDNIFIECLETNNVEIIEYLLSSGKLNLYKMNRNRKREASLLIYVMDEPDADPIIAKLLIITGKSEPGYINKNTKDTALTVAIKCGYIDIAKMLILTGESKPEAKNFEGKTALDLAEEIGDQNLIKILKRE